MEAANSENTGTEHRKRIKEENQEETELSKCAQTDEIVFHRDVQKRKRVFYIDKDKLGRSFSKNISKSEITSLQSSGGNCVNTSSNVEVKKEPGRIYIMKLEVCTKTENLRDTTALQTNANQETPLDMGKKTLQASPCGISNIETKPQMDSDNVKQQPKDSTSKLCELCGKTYPTTKQLGRHVANHKTDYRCTDCSYTTPYLICIQRHQTVHTREKKFTCVVCKKTLSQAANLKTHMKIHSGERPYHCKLCDLSFRQKINLQQHQLTHSKKLFKRDTTNDRNKKFPCDVCGKTFGGKQDLQRHTTGVHEKLRAFQCTDCDKQFSQLCNLKTHMKVHTGQRDFLCGACPKRYRTKYGLQYHMKIHKGHCNNWSMQ